MCVRNETVITDAYGDFLIPKICEEKQEYAQEENTLLFYCDKRTSHEISLLTDLLVYIIVLLSIGTMLYRKPLKLIHHV